MSGVGKGWEELCSRDHEKHERLAFIDCERVLG